MRRDAPDPTPHQPITGTLATIITGMIYLSIVAIALKVYRSPRSAVGALLHIIRLNKTLRGGERGQKYYRVGRRFFWSPIVPQWPSRPFVRFVESLLDRVQPHRPQRTRLNSVLMAVSSRCPLNCEHCLEGDNLCGEEFLSLPDLERILDKFRRLGVMQVILSGGEPLVRFDDVRHLLEHAPVDVEFSMLTSGFSLTETRARQLREAGLRSIHIALDHWDEHRHNRFRGHDQAFRWAHDAALNARRAGLLVGFSLCAVENVVDRGTLLRYLTLVKSWGGVSVRILEPRAVGRYAGRPVGLSRQKKAVLHDFYEQINTRSEYAHLPRLSYPEYHKKAVGCFGAGNRMVYTDSRGDVHPCPFCHGAVGNALTDDLGRMIEKLRARGCSAGRAGTEVLIEADQTPVVAGAETATIMT